MKNSITIKQDFEPLALGFSILAKIVEQIGRPQVDEAIRWLDPGEAVAANENLDPSLRVARLIGKAAIAAQAEL